MPPLALAKRFMVIAFSLLGVMENDSDIAAEHKFESKKPSVIHGICCYNFPCRTETLVAANDLDVKYPNGTKRKETKPEIWINNSY